MKKILSVSIGSSTRDHTTEVDFLGETCQLTRSGTDSDLKKAYELYKMYDGKVDAFGVGGIEFYVQVADRKYYFRDAKPIRKAIVKSKVGDGNGLKGILAQRALQALEAKLNEDGKTLKNMTGLKTTAVDRYTMAKAMADSGLDMTYGDLRFALGIPISIHSLASVRLLAAILMPVISRVPYSWLYPTGEKQIAEPENKYPDLYEKADVIGGDFLQIRAYLPPDLTDKIIVTNTTTAENVEMLQKRNLKMLVTSTPRYEGRSFGTNVMEATLRALIDKPDNEITSADMLELVEKIPLEPNIEVLN